MDKTNTTKFLETETLPQYIYILQNSERNLKNS